MSMQEQIDAAGSLAQSAAELAKASAYKLAGMDLAIRFTKMILQEILGEDVYADHVASFIAAAEQADDDDPSEIMDEAIAEARTLLEP